MKKNIIILGPPGSGKGTQAEILAKKLAYFWFSTGDLMRQEAEAKTSLGLEFQKVWDQGEGGLVSDELVNRFFVSKVKEIDDDRGFVFDGFPRSIKQAEVLETLFPQNSLAVINIEVPADDLIGRMETRRVCRKCGKIFSRLELEKVKKCDQCGGKLVRRQEDDPTVLRKRIETYEQKTKPLIDYFARQGNLINIDGQPKISEVEKAIWKAVNGN